MTALLYIYRPKLVIFWIGLFLFCVSETSHAAIFEIEGPASFLVGVPSTISIYVDSENEPLNAVAGTLHIDNKIFEVSRVSLSGSIISYWVAAPDSSASGVLTFEGIVPNPGYSGSRGKIAEVIVMPKTVGTGEVYMSKGDILANDGLGTNILSRLPQSKTFQVTGPVVNQVPKPVNSRLPSAPSVTSDNVPTEAEWYRESSPSFKWSVNSSITAVELLFDRNANSVPAVEYRPPIAQKQIEDVEDGVWYFHVRLRNEFGWGPTTHRKVQLDSTPPDRLELENAESKSSTGQVELLVDANDEGSGISHFTYSIDGTNWHDAEAQESIIQITDIPPGDHTVFVRAYDQAGNLTETSISLTVDPLPMPVFNELPSNLRVGDRLVMEGTAEPNAYVETNITNPEGAISASTVETNSDGHFVYLYPLPVDEGVYTITARTVGREGEASYFTPPNLVEVVQSPFIVFGSYAINVMLIIVPLLLLLMLALATVMIGWRKIQLTLKKMQDEYSDVEILSKRALDEVILYVRNEMERANQIEDHFARRARYREIRESLLGDLTSFQGDLENELSDLDKLIRKRGKSNKNPEE